MRLTLRTLLAYLDGILDENDAQELGKKIEESEFATDLVHRIQDAMLRLRLSAPNLIEYGRESGQERHRKLGFDPNTVAEYLDNTLSSDYVTDFEKVCLDSDVHLAEVASCHQILSLVLGEPAEIDPESRQRMYQLKDVAAGGKTPPPPPPVPGSSAAPPVSVPLNLDLGEGEEGGTSRRKPTVPEYLRDARRRPAWVPIAAALLLALGVLVVVLMLFGQFDRESYCGNLLARMGVIESSEEIAKKTPGTEGVPTGGTQTAAPAAGTATAGTAATPAAPSASTATAPAAGTASAGTASAGSATGAGVVPPTPATESGTATAGTATAGTATAGAATAEKATSGTGTETTPAIKPEVPKEVPGKTTPPPVAPRQPAPLGQLRSTDQVLLAADASGEWVRAATNQFLIAQQIMVLPTYRANVEMMRDVEASILGGTRVELLPAEPAEPLGMRIFYGRVVLKPLAKAGSRFRVAFGDHVGILRFIETDSTAAFDVHRVHVPGMNPETEPLRVMAAMYATIGEIEWTEIVDGKISDPILVKPRHRLSFDLQTTESPVAAKELPAWIVSEPIDELDRRASAAIAEALPTDRSARVGLLESAFSRPQREVKWLALRCLSYVGSFGDIVTALNDPNFRLNWPEYIDVLRAAVERDAESAAAVRNDLEKQYPSQSEELYRMLWGYTDKNLEAGDDAKLVRGLDDDKLVVRVLSIWNLKHITNLGGEYRPEAPVKQRQVQQRRWWQRLEAKEIRFEPAAKKPPARKPAAPTTPPPPAPAVPPAPPVEPSP